MKVFYGFSKIRQYPKPVVALGVFDGLHLGHRHILNSVMALSKRINGTSLVITFYPHPQGKESLYSLKHRLRLMEEMGIDVAVVIRFNKTFSRISAEKFIKYFLIAKIGSYAIYVGKNFRFGRNAEGDCSLLKKLSKLYHYQFKAFGVIKKNNYIISSTYIRRLITKGAIKKAGYLLSRPVSILGTVIKGVRLATKLGFPTANLNPHHEVIPPVGIYAVRVIFKQKEFKGACYIGHRPTFVTQRKKTFLKNPLQIEVHIFGLNKKIYGSDIEVQFVKKIRDEKKFSSKEFLIAQVKKDLAAAKKILTSAA